MVVRRLIPLVTIVIGLAISSQAMAAPKRRLGNPDINRDGKVNSTDLSTLAKNYGKSGTTATYSQGDINGDKKINAYDLSIMADSWNT